MTKKNSKKNIKNTNNVKSKNLDRLLKEAKNINIEDLINTKLFSKHRTHVAKEKTQKTSKKTKKNKK